MIPRPLRWKLCEDRIGEALRNLYGTLGRLRLEHPALRSAQMYPEVWEEWQTQFSPIGVGVDVARQAAIYHRWATLPGGDGGERRRRAQLLRRRAVAERPLPARRRDGPTSSGQQTFDVTGNRRDLPVPSNWGRILGGTEEGRCWSAPRQQRSTSRRPGGEPRGRLSCSAPRTVRRSGVEHPIESGGAGACDAGHRPDWSNAFTPPGVDFVSQTSRSHRGCRLPRVLRRLQRDLRNLEIASLRDEVLVETDGGRDGVPAVPHGREPRLGDLPAHPGRDRSGLPPEARSTRLLPAAGARCRRPRRRAPHPSRTTLRVSTSGFFRTLGGIFAAQAQHDSEGLRRATEDAGHCSSRACAARRCCPPSTRRLAANMVAADAELFGGKYRGRSERLRRPGVSRCSPLRRWVDRAA